MQYLRSILIGGLLLIMVTPPSFAAQTSPITEPATGNRTFIFKDEISQDFVVVSEKVDGKTEVHHIAPQDYENAIQELKKEGVISVCS